MSSEESLKRTRTSPRTLALDEVQRTIDVYIDTFTTLPAADPTANQAVVRALQSLKESIEVLRQGHPKTVKEGQSIPKIKGTHFVGETVEGRIVYVKHASDGSFLYQSTGDDTLAHLFGPFTTSAGAKYAAEHNTHTTSTQVF